MMDIKGFFEYFAGSGFQLTLTVMVLVAIFIFVALMLYIPVLARRIFPKFGYAKYADFLPFKDVYNDNSMSFVLLGFKQVCKIIKQKKNSWIYVPSYLIKFVILVPF